QHVMERRPDQPQDGAHISESRRSRDPDDEGMLRREVEYLQMQLREANTRAEQADRAAEELSRQLKSRRSKPVMATSDSVGSLAALNAEIRELKVELDDARSHIFSLQPYRKDITPKEVGQDFDDLVNGVTDWVTGLVDPVLDDDEKMDNVL